MSSIPVLSAYFEELIYRDIIFKWEKKVEFTRMKTDLFYFFPVHHVSFSKWLEQFEG